MSAAALATAAEPTPVLVQISAEGERNGRDDSDFYVTVFDLSSFKASTYEVGTTRAGNGACRYDRVSLPSELSPEDRARFEGGLWGYCLSLAESIEENRIARPGPLFGEWVPQPGTKVRLQKSVRNRNKVEGTCSKCGGGGKWTNPRNAADVRACFGCSGSGKRKELRKGGGTYEIPTGTRGTVVSASERRSQYGTWSYGATARIRLEDGSEINAPSSALRLDEEPDMKRARADAKRRFEAATTWVCHITGRRGQ